MSGQNSQRKNSNLMDLILIDVLNSALSNSESPRLLSHSVLETSPFTSGADINCMNISKDQPNKNAMHYCPHTYMRCNGRTKASNAQETLYVNKNNVFMQQYYYYHIGMSQCS